MTRQKRTPICLLALSITKPSAIQSLVITSHLTSKVTTTMNKFDVSGFGSSKNNARIYMTAIYSRSKDIQEFKDINIDDVLLEAENALKAAQTSLVNDDIDVTEKTKLRKKTEFKEIVIDDVLLEAETALKIAQTSLIDDNAMEKNGSDEFESSTSTMLDSLVSDDIERKTSTEPIEIVSSTLGGILLGSLLGSFADVDVFSFGSADFSSNTLQFVIPIIAGVILGGTAGFAGSLQDNAAGVIVRNALGVPTKALASVVMTNIEQAVYRQMERTTNDIKSIPSNVANSAKNKATETAKEAKVAVEMAIDSAVDYMKKLVFGLVIISSLVAVGLYFTDGQHIVEMPRYVS